MIPEENGNSSSNSNNNNNTNSTFTDVQQEENDDGINEGQKSPLVGTVENPEEFDFHDFCRRNHLSPMNDRLDDDLVLIKVIKRQISIFVSSGRINTPLLLNNTIVFFNCFENDAAQIILLYKIRTKEHRECMKSVLLFLMKLTSVNYFGDIDHDKDLFKLILDENPEHARRMARYVEDVKKPKP